MYEYDDGGGDGWPLAWSIAVVVALLGVGLVGWFVVRPRLDGNGGDSGSLLGDVLTTTTTQPVPAPGDITSDITIDTTTDVTTDTSPDISPDISIGTAVVTTTSVATSAVDQAPPGTTDTATTSGAATTEAATPGEAPYETLPDGSPAPVVALYDVSTITLTGAVPDQAAKDRLQVLAIGNAKPGQDTVANFLTINPSVPRHVGVRVVELTSVRFPEGSAEVLPPHALELDRVVSIMNALPNVTVLVIGHADQRGSDLANYEISEERADAVVDYIAAHGIEPSRLSSRAVGETDLLTLNNEPAALELNRRTEFVFYGLLME
jgi:outer membrane protein OmpA-like peptidoglycan-associated protein